MGAALFVSSHGRLKQPAWVGEEALILFVRKRQGQEVVLASAGVFVVKLQFRGLKNSRLQFTAKHGTDDSF